MEARLLKVKNVFDDVKGMRSEIGNLFEGLDARITKLKDVYKDFIKNTNAIKSPDVKPFIFSLDSFYFQTSLLEREFNYLKDYKTIIINRMYGEYYKLFKLINVYVERSHIDNKLNEILKNKKYPKYDDLDDSKEYDFNLIVQVNEDIMNIVNYLINILKEKELALTHYTTNQDYGLNVDNFVSTYNYEVIVLREQINLYEKYLEFFYKVHQKLLRCLIMKINMLEAQITTDIKFEGGLLSNKKDNSVLFEEMNLGNLSKRTTRDLRKSMAGKNTAIDSPHSSSNSSSSSYSEQSDIDNDVDIVDNIPAQDEHIINTNNTAIPESIVFDQPSIASKFFQRQDGLTVDIVEKIDESVPDNIYQKPNDSIFPFKELRNVVVEEEVVVVEEEVVVVEEEVILVEEKVVVVEEEIVVVEEEVILVEEKVVVVEEEVVVVEEEVVVVEEEVALIVEEVVLVVEEDLDLTDNSENDEYIITDTIELTPNQKKNQTKRLKKKEKKEMERNEKAELISGDGLE
jgi:hypothetical protein